MELLALGILCSLLALLPAIPEARWDAASEKFAIGEENLAPWANGLLKFAPVALGSATTPSEAKYPLLLAEKSTTRPDILNKLKKYRGGWDITNKHYWSSVASTGAAGFILALLWFISFGLAFGVRHCCKKGTGIKYEGLRYLCFSHRITLALLLVFTCVASTGCILLSVGQADFHGEVLGTLNYVVDQSDFTVQILKNASEYLLLAKNVSVDQVILPSNIQNDIDRLNVDLNNSASRLSDKTTENSVKIRQVFYEVRCTLIVVAAVMLFLALVGFLLSILGHKNAIYIFVLSGWLLVAVTFILCGGFVILKNAISDTCIAMDEWVHNPLAETALSNVLPCVDERTSNQSLHQSKEVTLQIVYVVDRVIGNIANSNNPQEKTYYNQSGPMMPLLCSPYDSELNDQHCDSQEVSLANATSVWSNYVCEVSASGLCATTGRVTPDIYTQLVDAVNASYALDHYTPLLLSLQNCSFVRDTFNAITTRYCPHLQHNLRVVNTGLGMISVGIMLCLVLWIFYANRPRREEVFVEQFELKAAEEGTP